jgi:ABC-type nitrate/sulfonate/bicarbonate transport system substrate-binding protein
MLKHILISLSWMTLSLSALTCFAQAPTKEAPTKMVIGTGVDPSLAQFYIAKSAGLFAKNGLDVQLNLGPSGSAMIAYVVGDQLQAALGGEQAGVQDHNLDPNVVATGESVQLPHFMGLVARNIDSLEALKGKRIGVDSGSSSQMFWSALVKTLKLDPKDYKIVQVEPPEMVAALERGDIDAFAAWEPWVTRAVMAVPNTKDLRDNAGIIIPRDYVYMNLGWAEKHKEAAIAFMRTMVEATAYLHDHPVEAAQQVAATLKLDGKLTASLMSQVDFEMRLDDTALPHMQEIEAQIKQLGKLAKPVDWANYFYLDPLRAAAPDRVTMEQPK